MQNPKSGIVERRKYVRLKTPLAISYTVPGLNKICQARTKNISADGLRFETSDAGLQESSVLELKINISSAPNPVHAKGKIVWKKKTSLEDQAPFDYGVELIQIEEDNKNTFLKYLCDLIYNINEETENENN